MNIRHPAIIKTTHSDFLPVRNYTNNRIILTDNANNYKNY